MKHFDAIAFGAWAILGILAAIDGKWGTFGACLGACGAHLRLLAAQEAPR